MPKMKSHSGAKKRFKMTAKGKIKFKRAKMRHMQSNKDKSMKRKARHGGILCDADAGHITKLLPYG
jgi:large subunit ribosomal protein L35